MARVMAVALDVMDAPFVWGVTDCSAAVCTVFHRLYGIDPMRSVRGTYTTPTGAARLIARYGGLAEMAAALAEREGLEACEPREGAIGVADKSLVICVSPRAWLGKTETGLSTVHHVKAAYHVPT